MIDGHIISKMNAIPVTLIPEIGIQIKFCDLYEDLTGKTIEYPPVSELLSNQNDDSIRFSSF